MNNFKKVTGKTFFFIIISILLISVQVIFADDMDLNHIIYFYPDTDVVKESSYLTLDSIVSSLKNNKSMNIKLDGYTNLIGETESELKLSKQRAFKVASFLIKNGVEKDRISTEGFGGNKLVVNSIDEINRRVEAVLIKPAVKTTSANVETKKMDNGDKRVTIEISDEDNNLLIANMEVKKRANDDLVLLSDEVVRNSIILDLPSNATIELLVSADNYMPKKVILENDESYVKIILDKIEIGKSYSIDNIYFDSMKSSIKRESYDILNEITNILKDNKDIKIKVVGHTQVANQKLSDSRADAVVKYFIRRNISQDRLASEGHSNKAFKEVNEKNEKIKNNKRVEFVFSE